MATTLVRPPTARGEALTSGRLPGWTPAVGLAVCLAVAVVVVELAMDRLNPLAVGALAFVLYLILMEVATRIVEGARQASDRRATHLIVGAFALALVPLGSLLWEVLSQGIARFDLQLEAVTRPSTALQRLAAERFDGLILDGMLPEMDGFEFYKRLRGSSDAWRDIPVLMLTARGDLTDRVVGLELGADDYLPKPFEPRELAARLQTILRRVRPGDAGRSGRLVFDGLEIDTQRREVRRQGEAVDLTGTEFELLLMLAREPGRVFSRDEILNHLRGRDRALLARRFRCAAPQAGGGDQRLGVAKVAR